MVRIEFHKCCDAYAVIYFPLIAVGNSEHVNTVYFVLKRLYMITHSLKTGLSVSCRHVLWQLFVFVCFTLFGKCEIKLM